MSGRLRNEGGFTLIEMVAALAVLSIALLALMAGYDSAFFSSHTASRTSSAAVLAGNQLELYASLPFEEIGLDQSQLAAAENGDPDYQSDEAALAGTDVPIAGCGAADNCLPLQTKTGSDRRTYTLETFVRDVVGDAATERQVTVLVRDADAAGTPRVFSLSTAFDAGPRP